MGITKEQILQLGTRLVIVLLTKEHFSFERKAEFDKLNERVKDWETLMDKYQQVLPQARPECPLHRRREDPNYATQSHADQTVALATALLTATLGGHRDSATVPPCWRSA